jgi:GNAT superfamily N-acetyltransferase
LVDSRRVPGVLAYVEGKPVGWCSVSPREQFHRLQYARGVPDSGGKRVWSIVCFFIHRKFRGRGIARKLLNSAIDYALSRGAEVIEAYPVDTRVIPKTNQEAWPGIASMFEEAGFKKVSQRSPTRPVMTLLRPSGSS